MKMYDGPEPLKAADGIKMYVNEQELFVYSLPVNNTHTWVEAGDPPMDYAFMAYYDCDGTAKVDIELDEKPISVTVRPLAADIQPKMNGNKVSFYIDRPGQYVIEFNGKAENAVHLFVNPMEKEQSDPDDEDTIFIAPGLWDIGSVSLQSGQTLYISGGAVVYGTVQATEAEDVTIIGRGIIDGSLYESWKHPDAIARVPISLTKCKNARVEGIICMNPNAWTINGLECSDSAIKNVKVISSRQNGDGISLQSCQNIQVSDSFVRSWDDSLVVKNYTGSSESITFSNITIWTDLAQSCEVGYETNKGNWPHAEIKDITFKDITVLHNFHKPVISIHNADDAEVHDIRFQNIVVEDASMGEGDAGDNDQLIDIGIMPSMWSSTVERGHIRDILIDNVSVLAGKKPSVRITGYDGTHLVENVSIRGLKYEGQAITSLDALDFETNDFAKGIALESEQ